MNWSKFACANPETKKRPPVNSRIRLGPRYAASLAILSSSIDHIRASQKSKFQNDTGSRGIPRFIPIQLGNTYTGGHFQKNEFTAAEVISNVSE
jgi:hypothetical protein